MSTNSINRTNDEEIIDIMNSILSNGNMQVETINYHTYTKYGKVQTNQQRVGVGRFFDRFYRLSDDNGTHRQFLGLW